MELTYTVLLGFLGCYLGSIDVTAMGNMGKMGDPLGNVTPDPSMANVFKSNMATGQTPVGQEFMKKLMKNKKRNKWIMKTIKSIRCTQPKCIKCGDLSVKLTTMVKRKMMMFKKKITKVSEQCTHETIKITDNIVVVKHTPRGLIQSGVKSHPAVVYSHPGGALFGGVDMFKPLLSQLAHHNNVVYIAVQYKGKSGNKSPVAFTNMVHNFYEAFKYIQKNGKKFGIDSNRVAIAGDSYGAQIVMATMVMLARNGEGKLAKLAMLGIPLVSDFHKNGIVADKMSKYEKQSSPIIANVLRCLTPESPTSHDLLMLYPATKATVEELKRVPPTIIFEKEFDFFKTEAKALATRLRGAGRLLHEYMQPGLKHRSMFGEAGKEYMAKYKQAIATYLIKKNA